MPHRATPAASTLVRPNLGFVDDGTEYIQDGDTGVSGLLARTVEVKEATFARHVARAVQQETEATLADKAASSWWTLAPKSVLGLPMIDPRGPFTLVWMSAITLLDLTYAAFWVPLNVAFCSINYGNLHAPCARADFAGGVIYTIHLLLNFSVGVVLTHEVKKKVIMDGRSVAQLYITHGRFWLDFVSVLPFIYLVIIVALGLEATRWVVFVSLFRLVRMSRLVSLGKIMYMDAQRAVDGSGSLLLQKLGGSRGAFLLIVFLGLATVVNLEACMLVLVAQLEGEENSWMVSFLWQDLVNASDVLQWYNAVYFAIASNTQTGAAGGKFLGHGEYAVCMVMQLVGMIMFSIVTTVGLKFATRISTYGLHMHRLGQKLTRVRRFVDLHGLPDHINKKIQDFYYESWILRATAVREDAVMSEMPPSMLAELLPPLTRHLVASCHYLGECRDAVQLTVCQSLDPIEVMPGVDLCSEGAPATCCWLLERGVVHATNMQGASQLLTAPCWFGETFIVAQDIPTCRERLWRYEVVVGGEDNLPAKLWRLKAAELTNILRAHPDFSTNLLKYLQGKLLAALTPGIAPGAFLGADTHWNELVSRIRSLLVTANRDLLRSVREEILQVDVDLGTLSPLLESLLSLSMVQRTRTTPELSEALSGLYTNPSMGLQQNPLSAMSRGGEGGELESDTDSDSADTHDARAQLPPLPTPAAMLPVSRSPSHVLSSGLSSCLPSDTSALPASRSPSRVLSGRLMQDAATVRSGTASPAHSHQLPAVSPAGLDDLQGSLVGLPVLHAITTTKGRSGQLSRPGTVPAAGVSPGFPAFPGPTGTHARRRAASPASELQLPSAPIFNYSPLSPGRPPPPQWRPMPADPTLAASPRAEDKPPLSLFAASASMDTRPLSSKGGGSGAASPVAALSRAGTQDTLDSEGGRRTRPSRAQREEAMYLSKLARNPTSLLRPPPDKVWQPASVRRRSVSQPSHRRAHGGDDLLEAAAALHTSDSEALQVMRSRRRSATATYPVSAAASEAGTDDSGWRVSEGGSSAFASSDMTGQLQEFGQGADGAPLSAASVPSRLGPRRSMDQHGPVAYAVVGGGEPIRNIRRSGEFYAAIRRSAEYDVHGGRLERPRPGAMAADGAARDRRMSNPVTFNLPPYTDEPPARSRSNRVSDSGPPPTTPRHMLFTGQGPDPAGLRESRFTLQTRLSGASMADVARHGSSASDCWDVLEQAAAEAFRDRSQDAADAGGEEVVEVRRTSALRSSLRVRESSVTSKRSIRIAEQATVLGDDSGRPSPRTSARTSARTSVRTSLRTSGVSFRSSAGFSPMLLGSAVRQFSAHSGDRLPTVTSFHGDEGDAWDNMDPWVIPEEDMPHEETSQAQGTPSGGAVGRVEAAAKMPAGAHRGIQGVGSLPPGLQSEAEQGRPGQTSEHQCEVCAGGTELLPGEAPCALCGYGYCSCCGRPIATSA